MFTGLTYDVAIPWAQSLPSPDGKWELIETIGEGTYGEVYKGRNCLNGEIAAIKVMDAILDKEEDIKAELNVFQRHCNHINLVRFYAAFLKKEQLTDDRIWLVMEYCSNGSVTDLVKSMHESGTSLTEDLIGYILKEVLSGLAYLHSEHCMHRDIKGQNCLLTDHAQVKLVDFGISTEVKNTLARRHSSIGTPYWMAPEVVACEHQLDMEYDLRADIWSFGVTAIEITDGVPPHYGEHPMKALLKIPKNPPPTLRHPERWSRSLNEFISKCLSKDFEKRPFCKDLQKERLIQDVPHNTKSLRYKILALVDAYKVGTAFDSKMEEMDIPTQSRTSKYVNDLATLESIDELTIVTHLEARYKKNIIYTYVGDILVSINPFKQLDIYRDEVAKQYIGARRDQFPPHIFAVGDNAYHALLREQRDQCCIISGESGAGKTEASNILVHHLMRLGKAESRALEEKILQVNPLMESFGNARTVFNSNSSRFGKYLELFFSEHGLVQGAHISEYLLEKSRVVGQARNERNFHIFYYLLAGIQSRPEMTKYGCASVRQHRYLRVGGTGKSGKKKTFLNDRMQGIEQSFSIIGFKRQEVESIYKILSAILHLGDVKIEEDYTQQYLTDAAKIFKNDDVLKFVSALLTVSPLDMRKVLTTVTVVTHGETIVRPLTIEHAMDIRDALAKALYGRLFSWIVNRINQILEPRTANQIQMLKFGILDIFGFENFKSNSFEQLCINIVNEQLQFYFNQYIFAWEQEEYRSEGIDIARITYTDNRPLLELFLDRPMGLLDLIDEESRFPAATDQTLSEKLHDNISSSFYICPKDRGPTFTILHYAGPVMYETTGFLEKNRDTLHTEVLSLLRNAGNPLARQLFQSYVTSTGGLLGRQETKKHQPAPSATPLFSRSGPDRSKGSGATPKKALLSIGTSKRAQTISSYFVFSLRDLMSKMLRGSPHFVRCIKPNDVKSSEHFSVEKVLLQLKYTGVMETTRIRKEGYSHRITFRNFLKRYKIISFTLSKSVEPSAASCLEIAKRAGLKDWAIGKSKIFLKYFHIERLNQKMELYHHAATLIQKVVRGFLACRKFQRMKQRQTSEAAIKIQKVFRGWVQRKKYKQELQTSNQAALVIQSVFRGWLAWKQYSQLKCLKLHAVVIIQKVVRGWLARRRYIKQRNELLKKLNTVLAIQSAARGWLVRRQISIIRRAQEREQQEKAIIVIQRAVRRWLCRCEFQKVIIARVERTRRINSAIIIQKAVRRWIAMKHYVVLREAAFARRETAAIVIQKVFRGWMARKKVRELMRRRKKLERKRPMTTKEDNILQNLQQQALVTARLKEHKGKSKYLLPHKYPQHGSPKLIKRGLEGKQPQLHPFTSRQQPQNQQRSNPHYPMRSPSLPQQASKLEATNIYGIPQHGSVKDTQGYSEQLKHFLYQIESKGEQTFIAQCETVDQLKRDQDPPKLKTLKMEPSPQGPTQQLVKQLKASKERGTSIYPRGGLSASSPQKEIQIVFESSPTDTRHHRYGNDLTERPSSRTKSTKIYFEKLADEQKKQIEASSKRGKSFFGQFWKNHDAKLQVAAPEDHTTNQKSFNHILSRLKSKRT